VPWDFLKRSDYVSADGSLDLLRKAIKDSISFDAYGDRSVFPAIVLVPPKALTITEAATHGAPTKFAVGQQARGTNYIFKVRILGNNSPHQYLPDPMDPSFKLTNEQADDDGTCSPLTIVSLHTTAVMIAQGSFGSSASPPAMGDIVEIRLRRNGAEGALNMQVGEYVKLVAGQGAGGTNFNRGGYTIAGVFDYLEGLVGPSGPKDDPSFTKCRPSIYPDLERRPTRFMTYNREQVLAAVEAASFEVGGMRSLKMKRTMWAFISKEQPNFNFPANNVAGIQLDNAVKFKGSGRGDFDYQTCFRDSGGEQRIFAGFETLERGMKLFALAIKGKMDSGGYKELTGTDSAADAEILTYNYFRNWNTQFSAAELIMLKSAGGVYRGADLIQRDWSATAQVFEFALKNMG
jgi:hypothetical protein